MPVDQRVVDDFVAALRGDPSRGAVLTDFDGTLSPIVDDPAAARPLPEVPQLLRRLARRFARVAVISGRPVRYLLDALGPQDLEQLVLSGSYGLERFERGELVVDEEATAWMPAVEAVASAAEVDAPAGVYVERKGLSVTLHARTAPAHLAWVRQWASAQADERGLVLHDAKMSLELRPPLRTDKGTITESLIEGTDAACFLGDDVGDLPAFDALDHAEANGVRVLRIAVQSAEIPPDIAARANLVVDGPHGAVGFLRRLLD